MLALALTIDLMRKMWPNGDQHIPGLMEGIVAAAPTVFTRYGIETDLVVAHMFAQFSEECGCGLEMIESLNYTSTRLRQVFPSHFTPTMAVRWAHNQEMIGEIAYGGRMGNAPPPSSDGYEFRGAGLSQVTGRDGVTVLQKTLDEHGTKGDDGVMRADFNIIENPELIIDPRYTLECGVADFIACGCLKPAEDDDVVEVTKKLNGGTNGLTERRRQLKLWKRALCV